MGSESELQARTRTGIRRNHQFQLRSEIYYNRPDQNISGLRFKPIYDLLLNDINWNEDFSAAEEIHVTLDINT